VTNVWCISRRSSAAGESRNAGTCSTAANTARSNIVTARANFATRIRSGPSADSPFPGRQSDRETDQSNHRAPRDQLERDVAADGPNEMTAATTWINTTSHSRPSTSSRRPLARTITNDTARTSAAATSAAIGVLGSSRSRCAIASNSAHGAVASCPATVANAIDHGCCARWRGVGAEKIASRCRLPGDVVDASSSGRLQQTRRIAVAVANDPFESRGPRKTPPRKTANAAIATTSSAYDQSPTDETLSDLWTLAC